MGIDKPNLKRGPARRKLPSSVNQYLHLLHTVYGPLSTRSGFNKVIYERLMKARRNRAPVSTSRISASAHKFGNLPTTKIFALVATVLDDERKLDLPPMRVAALRFSKSARERIMKAGGECLTLDQLAQLRPTGKDCILLKGDPEARKACQHFGPVPGAKYSTTLPYIHNCRKKENKGLRRKKRNERRRLGMTPV